MPSPHQSETRNAPCWVQLSDLVARHIGLHFPAERVSDLQRGVAAAAAELGFTDVDACAEWLLAEASTTDRLDVLARHLTIGETYFFRDRKAFDVIATRLLPELIQARRGREPRLRLWSAACATGEEAYSLAILLDQALPDLADWQVTILATDINAGFLRKAVDGVYGEWSFRDAPPALKQRYFDRTSDGRYAIRPAIRRLVTFEQGNLVKDVYPSPAAGGNPMDVILCRNVLMYFTPAHMSRVVGRLHDALREGGWLAVSPSEASHSLFRRFATRNFPGVILFQKSGAAAGAVTEPAATTMGHHPRAAAVASAAAPAPQTPVPELSASTTPARIPARASAPSAPTGYAAAAFLYEQGRYADAADALLSLCATPPLEPRACALLARALANQGRLAEGLGWCDRWIDIDKMNAAAHYVHAAILLEHGHSHDARRSLQRALYLDPAFVLAHFTLGHLARREGARGEAERHFANTQSLLERLPEDDALPEADGMTVGRLAETVAALIGAPPAP